MKKPIYVDEEIYDFLTTMRKDYGNYNNAIKAILHRLGSIYEELEIFRGKINHKESFEENLLMEMKLHPIHTCGNEFTLFNSMPDDTSLVRFDCKKCNDAIFIDMYDFSVDPFELIHFGCKIDKDEPDFKYIGIIIENEKKFFKYECPACKEIVLIPEININDFKNK